MQQRLLLRHLQDDTEHALDTYLACVSTASFISASRSLSIPVALVPIPT